MVKSTSHQQQAPKQCSGAASAVAPTTIPPVVSLASSKATTNEAAEENYYYYKTRWCKTVLKKKEECPYETRCMFAHSEEELRTEEQNIADGLVTAPAIREYQHQLLLAEKKRAKRKVKRQTDKIRKKERHQLGAAMAKLSDDASLPHQELPSNSVEMEMTPVHDGLSEDDGDSDMSPAIINHELPPSVPISTAAASGLPIDIPMTQHQQQPPRLTHSYPVRYLPQSAEGRSGMFVYRHNPYSVSTPFVVQLVC